MKWGEDGVVRALCLIKCELCKKMNLCVLVSTTAYYLSTGLVPGHTRKIRLQSWGPCLGVNIGD